MTRQLPSWTGDVELDRLELSDRVADAWADDLLLRHSRRLARALEVPWYVLLPTSWFRAFGLTITTSEETK